MKRVFIVAALHLDTADNAPKAKFFLANKFLLTKNWLFQIIYLLLFLFTACRSQKTFTNPLLSSGADPWSIYKDGYYYYTHTLGNKLVIWRTKNIAQLKTALADTVFIPSAAGTSYSRQLWAPEIHFIQNKWYIYFAADDGRNDNHRLYVLENSSLDPMKGEWVFKGKLVDSSDKWAIDASVFEHKRQMYMVWSGWEGDTNGQQDIYISKMKNAWTLEGERVRVSSPSYEWERHGELHDANNPPNVYVNEGPQFLSHGEKVFLIYSASGCWTENYCLGMLSADANSNLMDSISWKKNPSPVFTATIENKVYAPGHNSFFKSPDGKEDWILYHANSAPDQGCGGHRSPRAQKFTWNADGTPNFGVPVKEGEVLRIPSNKKRRHN
jgi:GH43 family beta-xylosidase